MPGWEGSTRKSRLPEDWPQRRIQVLARDGGRCQWRDRPDVQICGRRGNQVDHIIPGDDHRLTNLQVLCEPHHNVKSAREGGLSYIPLHRPPDPHPAFG